jgi:hypothetical protein
MESIFINIASYRDNELDRTITDCLKKAARPERLFFGVHWQHDSHEFFEQSFNPRVRVIETDYRQSRGACWARHEAQKLYNGEDYVLQLDSHMRFVQGWDLICIDSLTQLQERGNRKVIISNLMPSYDPDDDQNLPQRYLVYRLGEFNPDGALQLKASVVRSRPGTGSVPAFPSLPPSFLASVTCTGMLRSIPTCISRVKRSPMRSARTRTGMISGLLTFPLSTTIFSGRQTASIGMTMATGGRGRWWQRHECEASLT